MADTFQIPSLKNVPQELVDSTVAAIASRLTEYNPDIDFTKRAAFITTSYLHGLLLSGTTSELINQLKTNNLASLQSGLATEEQGDIVAKAFGITRKTAIPAKISALFVLTTAASFALSPADNISFGNLKFGVETSVSVRSSASNVSSGTDYVLTQIGSGRWGVVLPLTAKTAGAASNLSLNTALTSSRTITSLSKITVIGTIQAGVDAETNLQMSDRVLAASSIKTWASRSSFEAIARQSSTYQELVAVSVVGYGDDEQRRDRRGVLPIAHGGRTDLWVKFRPGLYGSSEQVTAALIAKTGSVGTWSFTLNGATFPGVYRVSHVTAVDDQSGDTFSVSSETGSLGVPAVVVIPRTDAERYVPDVRSAVEAAYSAYANVTVTFDDIRYDVTSASVGETREYMAHLYYEPLVETFQQELGKLAASNPAGDVLVRAAIPCEVTATISVAVYPGKTAPSADSIANAVVAYINATTFSGSLSVSDLAAAAGTVVSGTGTININYLSGSLKKPDGTSLALLMENGKLEIPDDPVNLVSANTVAFYSDLGKVSVIVQ
jgi:hypothetical protein